MFVCLRWIALLSKKINLSVATTGCFRQLDSVLKTLLVGVVTVYLCSVLPQQGPSHITTLLSELAR
jgi:dihydroorotate dehydrogenase